MKNYCILLLLTLGFSCTAIAQNVSMNKEEVVKTLCRQWKPQYAQVGAQRIDQLPGNMAFEVEFKVDNTFVITGSDKKKKTGKWTFNSQKKYVDLNVDNKAKLRITTLTKSTFTAVMDNTDGEVPQGLSGLQIVFVQK